MKKKKRYYGVGGSILKGASTGATIGSIVPGVGTAIGGTIGTAAGAITGFINEGKEDEQIRKEAQERQRMLLDNIMSNTTGILSTYPSFGVTNSSYSKGGILKYRNGGMFPLPQDNSSYEKLSSDTALYKGNTHEQGGIKIDNSNEIEDEEVIKDNKVYSDRLTPSSSIYDLIKQNGFNINNGTYANIAEELSKIKGKYEKKPDDYLSVKTKDSVINRVDQLLENLFEDQQLQNNNENNTEFKNGGNMNFKSSAAYKRWLAYGHATKVFENTPGNQDISIKGKSKKVEHAFGGILGEGEGPGDPPPKKTLPDGLEVAYKEKVRSKDITPLVYIEEGDPLFFNRDQFMQYYKNKAYGKLTEEDKKIADKSDDDAKAIIALRGGTPDYEVYKVLLNQFKSNTPTTGTPKYMKPKVGGYRYGAKGGKGLPAIGSITKRKAYGGFLTDNGNITDSLYKDVQLPSLEEMANRIPSPIANENYITDQINVSSSQNALPSFLGDIANVVGTLENSSIINKFKTNVPATTLQNQAFNYTNLSSPLYAKNDKSYREAVLGLQRSGQATPGTIQSLFNSKIENEANIGTSEAQRKQQAIDSYLDRVLKTNTVNSQIINQNVENSASAYNQKLGLQQGNIDNFIRGILENQTRRDLIGLDKQKAGLITALEGQRGITNRLRSNPQLAELLKNILG